eukprot:UN08432
MLIIKKVFFFCCFRLFCAIYYFYTDNLTRFLMDILKLHGGIQKKID